MSNLRFIADNGVKLPKYFYFDDAISKFCATEDFAFLSDRFGYLNQFSRIRAAEISKDKFPKSNSIKTFDECMIERANEIIHKCKVRNCKCYVLWSGGCDSTSVISSLIASSENLSFLEVLYTKSSINENPDMFYFIKSLGVSTKMFCVGELFYEALRRAKEGNIVLTGFPADQLFGSIIGQYYQGDTTKIHWSEYLKSDKANQQYEAAFEYYGLPIKNIAEFLWFNNFALKWDYVCYPALMMINDHHENIIPFFNTQYFEDWSISNFDILHKYDQKDPKNYKIQMKEFIYKSIGLKSVYTLKKVPSLAEAERIDKITHIENNSYLSAIDDEENIINMELPLVNKEYMEITGIASVQILRKFLKR